MMTNGNNSSIRPWQKGFELDHLKFLESHYHGYNSRIRSPFAQFKKHNIADALSKKEFKYIHHPQFYNITTCFTVKRVKVRGDIVMHGDTVIGRKEPGDIAIEHMIGDPFLFLEEMKRYTHEHCWLSIPAGSYKDREIAQAAGFKYVGVKINSFSDQFAFYFRDGVNAFGERLHPTLPASEKVGMKRIFKFVPIFSERFRLTLYRLNLDFQDHYSNYNKDHAWSALSLRGYSADPHFIEKPVEMNDKWKEAHQGQHFELQNTPLWDEFPEFHPVINVFRTEIHRVRLMKLKAGGGELQRHTDQVDPDAGSTVGKLARIHFPIITNPDVIFTTWDEYDQEQNYHFPLGEAWYLDTRKPHMAVNNGTEDRIHLVVDMIVTPALQKILEEA